MKLQASYTALLFALFTLSSAAPYDSDDGQIVMGQTPLWNSYKSTGTQKQSVIDYLDDGNKTILKGKLNLQKWIHAGKEYIKQDNLLYELVSLPVLNDYQLRFTEPELCDPSVQQYSGYLDIAQDKHLFFWFFESRTAPKNAPLILWLNGGPGGSSFTGMLFELGPCIIADAGKNTTNNPYSWNSHVNIIFLDQPVNVGYSYADNGTTVNSSPVAGKDVHAFLQLFLNRFPQYSTQQFHVAAESYGGIYAPNIARVIYDTNKHLSVTPIPGFKHINLASVVLANGLTDPYVQMASIPDYVCEGPFPIYDNPQSTQCQALRTKASTCQRLIKFCYQFNNRFACVPATLYCDTQLMGSLTQTELNPYDVRKKCDRKEDSDGPLCYKEMSWIDIWMNDPKNKASIGVNPERTFKSYSLEVNQAFTMNGDGMHNAASLLPDLINDGIRLLVYAGNADMMCNFIGNQRWVEQLETKFTQEYELTKAVPWVSLETGFTVGDVRSAGGGGITAGNVTYVTVYNAGHMVPYDQPEAALDLITRWVMDVPLSSNMNKNYKHNALN